MGTVYRARDLGSPDRTTVALKVVRGAFASPRFEREAMLLAQIENEGIVRSVAHGRIDAEPMYLAMEWLEGEGLDARLARGPLAIGECLALGRRVAHARGVIHRDVKPSNVLLRGGLAAEATLVDFGVGRARELALLESTFRECVDEPIARVLVVIAPPGIGKTRLRRELTARIATWESPPAVRLGLADPVMQGASYALAGDLLRRVLDLPPGDAKARREHLLARAGSAFIARFLGEIAGVSFGDDDDALRAARRSPELMRARIVEATCAFLAAELARKPVLLVVEDVHWADVASVRLLGAVLGRLKDEPLMILALARPSVDEVHPRL
jgi:hypothetical protein